MAYIKDISNNLYKFPGTNIQLIFIFLFFVLMISLSCQPKLARSTTLAQPVFQGKDTLKTLTGDNNISNPEKPGTLKEDYPIITGAERIQEYLPWLEGKKVALVVNQTSIVGQQHLVDVLLGKGVDIKKIFAPEHGFRDMADAGEKINNGIDSLTGLTCISLYGSRNEDQGEKVPEFHLVFRRNRPGTVSKPLDRYRP